MRPRNVLITYAPKTRREVLYQNFHRQFLDQSLWNVYVLYKKKNPTHNIKLLEFRLRIVEESIQKYSDRDNCSGPGRPSSTLNPVRLTARYFASYIPPNPIKKSLEDNVLFAVQEKMQMGKKILKETRIWCKDCEVGLCLETCFELYHTKLNF
ncbi:piggyBac transposable element-derived protein 4 [Trichonephila clavipes]|nr:piggyBac transposable element-derived protein 4 [Trichonephila clavipes]